MSFVEYDAVSCKKNWIEKNCDKLFKFKKGRSKIKYKEKDTENCRPVEYQKRVVNENSTEIKTIKINDSCSENEQKKYKALRSRVIKCQKRRYPSDISPITRYFHFWCPCFCCCNSNKISANRGKYYKGKEKEQRQCCVQCSDKGMSASTEKFQKVINLERHSNKSPRKSSAKRSMPRKTDNFEDVIPTFELCEDNKPYLELSCERILKDTKKVARYRRSDNQSIRDLRLNSIISSPKLHLNELKNKTAKHKEPESKNPIIVLELNNTMRTPVVRNLEFCKPEVHKPEFREPEVYKPEIRKSEVRKYERQKSGVPKPENQNPEVSKSEISNPEVT